MVKSLLRSFKRLAKSAGLFFHHLICFIMARIKYGSIATEIRGSIGGTTFQRNAYGYTIKNKPNMVRLQSESQNEIHRYMTAVSQRWLAITQVQRNHWEAFALAHPTPSVHNPDALLTGYTFFLKYNLIRAVSGVFLLDEPTDGSLTLPPINPYVRKDPGGLLVNPMSGALYLEWAYNVYLSPAVKATESYNVSKTRYVGHGNLSNSENDVTGLYQAAFGSLPSAGKVVFCEIQPWGQYVPIIVQSQFFILTVTS